MLKDAERPVSICFLKSNSTHVLTDMMWILGRIPSTVAAFPFFKSYSLFLSGVYPAANGCGVSSG